MAAKKKLPWRPHRELPEDADLWRSNRAKNELNRVHEVFKSRRELVAWKDLNRALVAHPPGQYYEKNGRRYQSPYLGEWPWFESARILASTSTRKIYPWPPFVVPVDAEPRYMHQYDGMHPVDVMLELDFAKKLIEGVMRAVPGNESFSMKGWKPVEYDERLDVVLDERWEDLTAEMLSGTHMEPGLKPAQLKAIISKPHPLTLTQKQRVGALHRYSAIRRNRAKAESRRGWNEIVEMMLKAPPGRYVKTGTGHYQKPYIGSWEWWKWAPMSWRPPHLYEEPPFVVPLDAEPRFLTHNGGMHRIDIAREMGLSEEDIRFTMNGEGKAVADYDESSWVPREYDTTLDGYSAPPGEF